MRIGFDCDGPLVLFEPNMVDLIVRVTGRNLFPPDFPPINGPAEWDWWAPLGYTREELNRVWDVIKASPSFWYSLPPAAGCESLAFVLRDLEHKHDVYFITNRMGLRAKRQTEAWLCDHLPYDPDITPTVLLASAKGAVAKALKLDIYLDDNLDNAKDVLRESPKTRMYLLDRSYNQGNATYAELRPSSDATPDFDVRCAIRVNSLAEMLDAELANL